MGEINACHWQADGKLVYTTDILVGNQLPLGSYFTIESQFGCHIMRVAGDMTNSFEPISHCGWYAMFQNTAPVGILCQNRFI